jgi:hypothetical protein
MHDKKRFWLVWQNKTGQNIIGQRFNQSGARLGKEIVLLTHPTALLKLYGASGQANASDVDLNITYKKTEDGVDQIFIASFTKEGKYHRAPYVIHDNVGNIEQMIALHRNTYKYLTLTVGTGTAFGSSGMGIQGRNVALVGPTGVTLTSHDQIPDDKRSVLIIGLISLTATHDNMATANLACEVLPSSVYFSCTAVPGTKDQFQVNYNGHEYAKAGITPPY